MNEEPVEEKHYDIQTKCKQLLSKLTEKCSINFWEMI